MLLITALCISCQKEQNSLEEKGAPANEVVIRATISDAATKVSFTEDATTLKTAWETNDHIVGWDAEGKQIELEIVSIENNNTAIFKTVEGSAPIPTSGKVYMIYAPGKSKADISNSSLVYNLSDQGSGKLPALMTATGEVSGNVLELTFENRLAIVAVKNPTFPVTEATDITGLQLSGDNILTTATFSEDGSGGLQMISSVDGTITRACDFTTAADGTSETMVYFAVLPNSTAADVTVSTTAPEGYQISFPGKSFTAGMCYMLNQKDINKQTFTVTVANGITGGTISTSPSGNVAWDTEVTVTATPNIGYELTPNSITVTDAGSGSVTVNANKFTMPQSNVTVSGTFTPISYTLTGTPSPTEGGSVTFKKGEEAATVAYFGDEITIVSTPNTDYVFSSVSAVDASDGSVTITDNTFTMPASNVTVTTTFAKKSFNITKTDVTVTGGSFKVKKGDTEVTSAQWDETIKVEVTKPQYYAVDKIKVYKTGESSTTVTVNADGTFTMPKYAVTIKVTFTPDGSAPPTEMPETIGL